MTYKHLFFDDYSEGAHPRILAALQRTNLQQEPGYMVDSFAVEATRLIREKFNSPDADVHFVASGTGKSVRAVGDLKAVGVGDCRGFRSH